MMRRRSSSRCSRKLMLAMRSSRAWRGVGSAVVSGIGSLAGDSALGGAGCGPAGGAAGDRTWRRQDAGGGFGLPLLQILHFELAHLRFQLRLELVAGAAELPHRPPDLAPDLRQLLGPEDQQG